MLKPSQNQRSSEGFFQGSERHGRNEAPACGEHDRFVELIEPCVAAIEGFWNLRWRKTHAAPRETPDRPRSRRVGRNAPALAAASAISRSAVRRGSKKYPAFLPYPASGIVFRIPQHQGNRRWREQYATQRDTITEQTPLVVFARGLRIELVASHTVHRLRGAVKSFGLELTGTKYQPTSASAAARRSFILSLSCGRA
jgi:hypothetical protein